LRVCMVIKLRVECPRIICSILARGMILYNFSEQGRLAIRPIQPPPPPQFMGNAAVCKFLKLTTLVGLLKRASRLSLTNPQCRFSSCTVTPVDGRTSIPRNAFLASDDGESPEFYLRAKCPCAFNGNLEAKVCFQFHVALLKLSLL
jgi:hypothetical protein